MFEFTLVLMVVAVILMIVNLFVRKSALCVGIVILALAVTLIDFVGSNWFGVGAYSLITVLQIVTFFNLLHDEEEELGGTYRADPEQFQKHLDVPIKEPIRMHPKMKRAPRKQSPVASQPIPEGTEYKLCVNCGGENYVPKGASTHCCQYCKADALNKN